MRITVTQNRPTDPTIDAWMQTTPQWYPAPNASYVNPILWLDSDTATLVDGKVSSWTDLSGNGYHMTQATADRRPTWTANAVNGHAAINFTRANTHWLQSTFAQAEPCDVIMVARVKIGDGVSQYVIDTPTSEKVLYYYDSSDNNRMFTSGAPGKEIANLGGLTYAYHVVTMRWKAGTGDMRSDGVSVTSGALNDNALDGIVLGQSAAGTYPTTMDVAWFGVFPATLSAAQLSGIETFLKNRYGTP